MVRGSASEACNLEPPSFGEQASLATWNRPPSVRRFCGEAVLRAFTPPTTNFKGEVKRTEPLCGSIGGPDQKIFDFQERPSTWQPSVAEDNESRFCRAAGGAKPSNERSNFVIYCCKLQKSQCNFTIESQIQ